MRTSKCNTIIAILVFSFLLFPLIIIVMTAFNTKATIQFPIEGFTLTWFAKVFENKSFIRAFKVSMIVSIVSTITSLLVGVPAAYYLSKSQGKYIMSIKNFFLSPSLVPGIVLGFALYQSIVLQFKISLLLGLNIGHTLIILPYIVRVVGASLDQFDSSIEEAAWSLGCTRMKTFFTIVLPNIKSAIIAACMLGFINSFNNVPVSMFLSGANVTTLPITLMSYIEYTYNPTISALSVLMMVMTIIIMVIIEKTLGLNKMK